MALSQHGCGTVTLARSTSRWFGNAPGFLALAMLGLLPAVAFAADGGSPSLPPQGRGESSPGIPPQQPMEPGVPPAPSPIDPGIQHVPETRGVPGGAVKPPIVDPGMAVNPDTAPPARKGAKPPGGDTPPRKPGAR